jgi:glycosyltransferase involved in cell wall biosynthesis
MCVLEAPGGEVFTNSMRDLGLEVVVIPAGPDVNPSLIPRLRAAIKALGPDVIHTHLFHADTYGQLVARSLNVTSVMSLHSAIFQYWSWPIRRGISTAARAAAEVIAISRYVADVAERCAVTRSATVVRYGIDAQGSLLEGPDRARVREDFGWDEETFVIGAAARMIPKKGHDLLLEAFEGAQDRLPKSRLVLAGDGPLRKELELRFRSLGDRVEFLGFRRDITSFLNACDVVVFPTRNGLGEGFGLAALEAMAAARPTVATKVDALPELIEHEVTGLLVDPDQPDSLSAALVTLSHDVDLRERLRWAAYERATTRFTAARMADETLSVYERAVGRGA